MNLPIIVKLILSLLLGMAIGLERESYELQIDKTKRSGIGSLGIRSFALITTLGTVAALLIQNYFSLFLIISVTFSILLVSYYILGSLEAKDNGLTTELAVFWSYLIGVLVGLNVFPVQLIVAMTVILMLILSLKQKIKLFVSGIKQFEIESFISYAIIALVILPFLPNTGYFLKDVPFLKNILSTFQINFDRFMNLEIINFFSLWKVVALVTGVEIAGYFLEKTIGQKKGWLMTSIAGGFISSTSTTQSLAQKSKHSKDTNRLAAAAIFANFSSFIQMFILIASVNLIFLSKNLIYIFSISLSAILIGIYFLRKEDKKSENLVQTKENLKKDKIFSLMPALKFALLFLVIKIVTKFALIIFGNSGFIISTILGAVTGLDAITINTAELAGKTINYQTGVITLILANAVNLLSKSGYAFAQGSRSFARKFFISVIIIIAFSFLGLIPFIK
ncbi:MAG: MgtC/SapB family protein [Patescibacteria group bacterium]